MANTYDRNLDQKYFVNTQTVITTATATTIAATDAFKALGVDIDTQDAKVMLKRNDNKAGRDELEKVDGKEGPYSWSISANVVPSGTPGTAADIADIYNSMFSTDATTAFLPDVAQATTGCTSSTTGAVEEGQVLVIPHSTTGEPAEAVYITGVSTVSSQDVITWWPDLSFTPSASNSIGICVNLTPQNAVATTDYLTIKRAFSSAVQNLAGALPDTLEINFRDGEFVEQTISGQARNTFVAAQTTLDGSHSTGGTTLTVNDAALFKGTDTNHQQKLTIEAEGINSAETVTITAVDEDNDQLTCSALAGDHGSGANVVPYVESETTAGSPIAGVSGKCFFDDESTELSILNASFTIAENFVWRSEYGDAKSTGAVASADRTLSGSVNLTGKASDWTAAGLGERREEGQLLVYAGDTAGAVFGIMIPKAYIKAKVENGGDGDLDKITLTLDRALGDSGDDSFVVFFG